MGCVQAKPASTRSPPRGLDRMKRDHGYVPSSDYGGLVKDPARPHSRTQVAAEAGDGGGNVLTREGEREGYGLSRRILQSPPMQVGGGGAGEVVDGWPRWLTDNIPKQVLAGLVPKSADSYEKIDKIGQGTYSNVYKARDRDTGKIVAMKKVRFDTSESESVRFMAREIMILQKLDHPNVMKLEGLATSRMQYSLYLVFDFMQTDLTRVISCPDVRLTEPQVKCYMQQLLSGLQHCHERGILHRDIKGSNLLIDKNGMLKIADFGLANYFNPNLKRPLTSRVVTLWYRAPELLLGATDYGVGIDLWSAGCLLGELFAGRPIMPGRTEVEQLHRIFKLCGSPSEDYWRKLNLSTSFRPPQPYKPSILEIFRDFPSSSLSLLMILLALDPSNRGSAAAALQHDFFSTSPLACDLSGLPIIYKENDDSNRPRERRKRKKLKQRSQTQKEGQRKTEHAMLKAKADSGSSKEEKVEEPGPRSSEFGSSTGSTSSSMRPQSYPMSPNPSLSPRASPLIERSRRSESSRTSVPRNIMNLPPLPTSTRDGGGGKGGGNIENPHRYGNVKRSASTSGFRRFEENHIPKQYVLAD